MRIIDWSSDVCSSDLINITIYVKDGRCNFCSREHVRLRIAPSPRRSFKDTIMNACVRAAAQRQTKMRSAEEREGRRRWRDHGSRNIDDGKDPFARTRLVATSACRPGLN